MHLNDSLVSLSYIQCRCVDEIHLDYNFWGIFQQCFSAQKDNRKLTFNQSLSFITFFLPNSSADVWFIFIWTTTFDTLFGLHSILQFPFHLSKREREQLYIAQKKLKNKCKHISTLISFSLSDSSAMCASNAFRIQLLGHILDCTSFLVTEPPKNPNPIS